MKAAVYARVSTEEQVEGYSLDAQLEAMRDYAKINAFEIVDEYVDGGFSARSDNRPAFKRIIADAKAGKFDFVVVHKFDRFSRNREHAVTYKALLRKIGIRVLSVMEPIEPDSPTSIITEGMLEVMAEWYSANLAQEVRKGKRKAAKEGKWNGGFVKYGYRSSQGQLEVDEREAEVVRGLFQWVAEGKTASSWCRWANQVGIPTKRRGQGWTPQQANVMLHDMAYTGKGLWGKLTRRGGKVVPGDQPIPMDYPIIISEELFLKVQSRLLQNRKKNRGTTKRFYLLQHLGRCGECGGSLSCLSVGKYRYLYCLRQRSFPHLHECYRPQTWDMEWIERHIWADVEEVLTDDYQEAVIQRLAAQCGAVRETLEASISKARKELERCQLERQRILTAHRKGWATEAEASLQFKAIKADEEQWQLELAKAEASRANTNAAVELIHTQIGKVLEVQNWWWHTTFGFTDQQKKEILNTMADSFVLYRDGRIELRLKVPTSEADMAKVLTQSLNA